MIPSVIFNAILNILSAAVALMVSFYAYKTNRLVGSQLLRYINVGFLLLGVGLATEGLTQALAGLTPVAVARFTGLEGSVFLIDMVLQVVAYVTFAWGYALGAFGRSRQLQSAAAASPAVAAASKVLKALVFSLGIFLFAQLGIIVLMLFVVAQGFFVYSASHSRLALTVLSGFTLILAAHITLFVSVIYLSERVFLIGTFIQFLGFLSLLFFLYGSSHVDTV